MSIREDYIPPVLTGGICNPDCKWRGYGQGSRRLCLMPYPNGEPEKTPIIEEAYARGTRYLATHECLALVVDHLRKAKNTATDA
jgi:hypothetical protein